MDPQILCRDIEVGLLLSAFKFLFCFVFSNSMATVSIPKTFGALLLGGLCASMLSGFVIIQVVVYFKLYRSDRTRLKALVLTIWFLDTVHTVLIWLSLWSYFIGNYGKLLNIINAHWSLALGGVPPTIITLLVHIFFAQRIFMLSKRNYILTVPIVALAICRLVFGFLTSGFLLHFHTFTRFEAEVKFLFTTGLALSSAVDVIITASLFILLLSSRTGQPTLDAVIDALIRYTFETSSLTCAGTIASMLCWLIIPNNLIFMGLHFVIGKLYANSLLVTLNTRESIRRRSQDQPHGLRVVDVKKCRKLDISQDSSENTVQSSQVDEKLEDSEAKFMEVEVVVEHNVQVEQV